VYIWDAEVTTVYVAYSYFDVLLSYLTFFASQKLFTSVIWEFKKMLGTGLEYICF